MAAPAASATDEQIRLLRRHQELIEKLKEVVATQRRTLEALGADHGDSTGPAAKIDKADSDNEGEENALAAAIDKKQSGKRRQALAAAKTYVPPSGPNDHADEIPEGERGFMATKPWLGAMTKPTTWDWAASAQRDAVPTKRLTLEHVHGYRSRACRNNIAMLDATTIVYPVAAVCVVMNTATKKQKFFLGHDDDVLCLDYNHATRMCASGQIGKNPELFVWNVDEPSGAPVAVFKDHARAVVAVNFTPDGSKLASIGLDDDHTMNVYDMRTKTRLATVPTGSARIVAVYWNLTTNADPRSELVTIGANALQFWNLAGGVLKARNGTLGKLGKQQTFLDAAFTPEYTLVSCESGELYAFEGNALRRVADVHNGAAFSVVVDAKNDRIITGGRDGFVNVWDRNSFKNLLTFNLNKEDPCGGLNSVKALYITPRIPNMIFVGCITSSLFSINTATKQVSNLHTGHFGKLETADSSGEVWGLTVHPTKPIYATTGEDSSLRIWDIATKSQIGRVGLMSPSRCCDFSADGNLLCVGHEDGSIVLIDAVGADRRELSRAAVRRPAGQNARCTTVQFSPDGTRIVVGVSMNRADVFALENGTDLSFKFSLTGPSSLPLSIDFSADGRYIMLASQGYELLFYTAADGKPFTRTRELADVQWATHSSKLGWAVQGIWPGIDGTDVNSVAVSRDGKFCVTGEDTGLVKVFNFPCVGSGLDKKGSLLRKPGSVVGAGHSEHVTNAMFSVRDSHVITCGGGDMAVMQWVFEQ